MAFKVTNQTKMDDGKREKSFILSEGDSILVVAPMGISVESQVRIFQCLRQNSRIKEDEMVQKKKYFKDWLSAD